MQEFILQSGRKVRIIKGKAKDLVKAQMMVDQQEELALALLSLLVEVDGQKLTLEDAREMDIPDVIEILPFLGLNPMIPPQSSSASASKQASGTKK